ncbi:MAG: 2OG-Fe(II) oxygenase family protein [Candidatus Neomarinimicrobiota bacterium]|nr:2OG-Fe(II) oxygenase family protein [Candidatus Neomarinimicrobiota bacterium]
MSVGVLTVDFRSAEASSMFVESLRTTGFSVLKNQPVPPLEIAELYGAWATFFASDRKFDYQFDEIKQDGYFPFLTEHAKGYSVKDLKEFYHIYPWGRFPEEVRKATQSLYNKLMGIASVLLSWIQDETPEDIRNSFSMPLNEMILKSDRNLLRIIHYPPLTGEENEGAVRAANHEDINLITVLAAGTQPGLEVRDVDGKWHEVSCDAGMLVVNTGDMLQMASDGYYPSTTHKVANPSKELAKASRYSMPLFLHPKDDVVLSSEHTAESYLNERLREIGLKQ